jgi:filamentous hemagglutinin family protein
MNARSFKVIFSKRLGALVAVGENTTSQGKSASGEANRTSMCVLTEGDSASQHVGTLKALCLAALLGTLSPAFALDANALPTQGQVVLGSAAISSIGAAMTITQSTDRAAINWQSFNVGTDARVNVVQNNSQSVLLNRVVGNEMSQIRGQISANGQVILVNPNGIVMGPTGRITASAFTASTFGITDANFEAGHMKYERNGSTGKIVHQGHIQTAEAGGYVALIGADVNNQGAITTRQGAVVLAAADAVTLPSVTAINNVSVPLSSKVRLELNPDSFGSASVSNSGVIVTDGGQVLMRAAAVVDAVSKVANATVVQSGSIDTTGAQGGGVDILADNGRIRVSGSIKANSTDGTAGGDVYIGRDENTNVLAAVGNVSGAYLESTGGFVETSGQYLATNGVSVKAKEWLLDPTDIIIVAGDTGTPDTATVPGSNLYQDTTAINSSEVLKSTIETAINGGTSVTISTANGLGLGSGNITIATALDFNNTGAQNATFKLDAVNGITQNAGATITAVGSKNVNIEMLAKGEHMGVDADSASSKGIVLNSTIKTNGTITMDATSRNNGDYGNGRAIVFESNSGIEAASFNILGKATTTGGFNHGVRINGGTTFTATDTNTISLINGTAVSNNTGVNSGVLLIGENIKFNGNMVVKGSNVNTNAGVRVSAFGEATSIITDGNVTLGAHDQANSSFTMRAGSITANSGSLNILGTSVSNEVDPASITANNGVTINIEGKTTAGSASNAVSFNNIKISALKGTAATAGDINITGTASAGGAIIVSNNNSTIVGGNVNLIGKSDTTYTAVTNIAGSINASGDVKVEGTGAAKHGIFSNSNIKSEEGSITLLGDVSTAGSGVGIGGGGTMTAKKDITITGKTVGDSAVNVGALDAGGNITIEGTSQYKNGILINNTVRADGLVKMTGNITANLQNSSNQGIYVAKNVTGGAVVMNGTSEGSTGVDINAKVESTSATAITSDNTSYSGVTLIGKGGIGRWYNQGVWTRGAGTIVSASTVDIKGENTYSANNGNMMGAQIQGTVTAAGDIKLEGNTTNIFSPNRGLVIENLVKSTGGNITVTGSVVNGERVAVLIKGSNAALVTDAGDKAINMIGNSMDFSEAKEIVAGTGANSGKGTVNIATKTSGNVIRVGMDEGASVGSELRLNQTELNKITAGKTVIGDTSTTGGITVTDNAIATNVNAGDITLQTAGNINVGRNLSAASGKNLTLQAKGDVTVGAAISQAGAGNIVIAAGLGKAAGDGTGVGQVKKSGSGSISNAVGSKTYIYTGEVASSATMNQLNSSFSTLNLSGVNQNAKSNTATLLTNTIASDANTQVLYREKIAVDLTDKTGSGGSDNTLVNATKTYGQVANDADAQTALKAVNSPSAGKDLSWSQSGNNFKLNSNTLIDNLSVDAAAYSTAGKLKANDTAYNTKSNDYTFTSGSTLPTLKIDKLALTGTIATGNSTYGDALAAGAVNLTNKVGDDVVTPTGVTIATAGSTSTSGNLKADTHTGIQSVTGLTGNDAENYTFADVKGDYTVDKWVATISATPTQLTFTGTTLNQAAPTTSNLIDGDDLTVTGVASGQAEGTYSSALDVVGDDKGNYTFTFTNANLVITANTTPIPPGPVVPPTPPSPNNNTVVVAGGSNSFQLAGAEATCSADTLEQCECESATSTAGVAMAGVQICYEPKNRPSSAL